MEGYCSTGQSPQWAVVPMEEEEGYVNVDTEYTVKHRMWPTSSGVPRGWFGGSNHPRNSEGPPKSCQTQPDCENC